MTDGAPADTETPTARDAATSAGRGTRAPGTVVVRIPGPLRPLADGRSEVHIPAGTVATALEMLVARHPGLRRHLVADDGAVRDHVNIFVGEDDIRFLDGAGTVIEPGETLTIVPSIAGG